jgi:formylglycine-generating enzyme required for sulfatase activity
MRTVVCAVAAAVMLFIMFCCGCAGNNAKGKSAPAADATDSVANIDMVFVKGGTFTMGCTEEQDDYCREDPHTVAVHSFYMGKTEVTQGLWKSVMGNNPSDPRGDSTSSPSYGYQYDGMSVFVGDDNPVDRVSWEDVHEFILKLNAKTGKEYRLPNEEEWEYAARGGNKSKGYKYSGSDDIDEVAWYGGHTCDEKCHCRDGNGCGKIQPVGTKAPNELGIHDMSGNVSEWVIGGSGSVARDSVWWYVADSSRKYRLPTEKELRKFGAYQVYDMADELPEEAMLGSGHVIRGGDWYLGGLGVADNMYNSDIATPGYRHVGLGFRLAMSSDDTTTILLGKDTVTRDAVWPSPPDVSFSPDSVAMVFVKGKTVPVHHGGGMMVGCTAEQDEKCDYYRKLKGNVQINDYYIGKTEVTQGLWKAVLGNNPSEFKGDDRLPVEMVSYYDVQMFIQWLNIKTGKKYRLPTKLEWEYAARGGDMSKGYKYSGSNNIYDVAWRGCGGASWTGECVGSNSGDRTHPVGTKKANELGIHDMSGNVEEWTGTESGWRSRVHSGGSWRGTARDCLVHSTSGQSENSRNNNLGFRLALDP